MTKQIEQDEVEAMFAEATESVGQRLTEAEVAFVEGPGAWRSCPVDGTRFFYRSAQYPLGREPGSRWCSVDCETRARAARGEVRVPFSGRHIYTPDVDGTLGHTTERAEGGPIFIDGHKVDRRALGGGVTVNRKGAGKTHVRMGTAVTAYPSQNASQGLVGDDA
jgi:hypothetical protein